MIQKLSHGFTLIELMLVTSIIGLLTTLAIPKFINLERKANEAATKANLGILRSTLRIFFADTGTYPTDSNDTLTSLTNNGKYIAKLPKAYSYPYHPATNSVHTCDAPLSGSNDGYSGWVYDFDPAHNSFGTIWVSCTHSDLRGSIWTSY